MRTIKFRVWDNELGFMYAGTTLEEMLQEPPKWRDYYVWEQFTGLHDKNGVEIYEGDIVHLYYYRQNDLGETLWLHRNVLVKWSDDDTFYGIGGWDGDDYFDIATRYRHSIQEVIGNIHEEEMK